MRDATSTALQSTPTPVEPGADRMYSRPAGRSLPRQSFQAVVNLGRQDPVAAHSHARQDDGSHNVSQAGQAFLDLLLVGSTAARCPLALLTVARGDGWSTLAFGAEREALEDPELFSIIAGRREPVEVTDPASNPALSNSRLARSSLGIRWLLGVPLLGRRRGQRHLCGPQHRAEGADTAGTPDHGRDRPPRQRGALSPQSD